MERSTHYSCSVSAWRPPFLAHRKVIASIGVGPHEELLAITRPSRVAYAARHGYDLVEETADLAPGRPASWGKVKLVTSLLNTYQTVVWIDADAILVDHSRDIAADSPPSAKLWMVTHRYDEHAIPNMGVMVVHRSRWTTKMFDRIWNAEEFITHDWWENAALLHMLGYNIDHTVGRVRSSVHNAHVGELPDCWNVIPQAQQVAPAIVHFPGFPSDTRRLALQRLARDPSAACSLLADPHAFSKLSVSPS